MMYDVKSLEEENDHIWASIHCTCDLNDDSDELISWTCESLRDVYGETELIRLAQADPLVSTTFDLNAIIRAYRDGLPDPTKETNKPKGLENYRSEVSEIVARDALASVHSIEFPVSPQRGKPNPNQPILGFDGWGFLRGSDNEYYLVLMQVKSTDEVQRPPREALRLAKECVRVTRQKADISRALTIIAISLKGSDYSSVAYAMLEALGNDILPRIVVAPAIIRGKVKAEINDLTPVRTAVNGSAELRGRGVVLSIGADLSDFGKKVVMKARVFQP